MWVTTAVVDAYDAALRAKTSLFEERLKSCWSPAHGCCGIRMAADVPLVLSGGLDIQLCARQANPVVRYAFQSVSRGRV